jgi:hypothetical protein
MRRRYVALGFAVTVLLILGVVLVYPYLTTGPNPLANNQFLIEGHQTYYAYGGSASVPVALTKSYRLTGGFETNSSLVFYVMTSQEYGSQSPKFRSPLSYYYSTGNVKSAVINTTLYAGDYDLVFDFVNDTGRLVTTSNGTSLVSTTTLTITQNFVLTPLP